MIQAAADSSAIAGQPGSRVQRTGGHPPGHRRYQVLAHGLTYFCRQLPELLGNECWEILDRSQHTPRQLARLVQDLRTCDLAFSWGGRIDMGPFLWGARVLGAKKIVTLWCGSDVLRAQKILTTRKPAPWIARNIHWAASRALADEVRALGLSCEYVQCSFVEAVARPAALPKEFSVLVFLPRPDLADLYGWDRIVDVARALPEVKFTLVGLRVGTLDAPPNVEVRRWVDDLVPVYQRSTVLWRPVRHDAGIAFMVLEAMAHGRHVLYSYPVPGAVQVKGALEAREQLENLRQHHRNGTLQINEAGRTAVARIYRKEVVRDELRRRWEEIIRAHSPAFSAHVGDS